jgi:hypothetical protein
MNTDESASLSPNTDPKAMELLEEIRIILPDAENWLRSPHRSLGDETPAHRIQAGDVERVRNLFELTVYVGVV